MMANVEEEFLKLVQHAENAVSIMYDFQWESGITSGF